MQPLASIVIVTYGNRAATECCLRSLDRALGPDLGDRYELVLVDNNSPDDTLELLRDWSDRANVIPLPENRNFAGGSNAGARAARGEVVIFLNNDTEVPRGAIETITDQALDPGVGIVGARLLFPDGRIQHAGVAFLERRHVLPMHLFAWEPGDLPAAQATYDLDATTGACLAVRRALFHELGGFDEIYANGLEDIDFCVRVRVAGHRVVYRGDVAIIHHEKLTRGGGHDDSPNLAIFRRRWAHLCAGDDDLLEHVFGARFMSRSNGIAYPQEWPGGSATVFGGEFETMSAEAAEARALLWLTEAAGVEPALRDGPPLPGVLAQIDDDLQCSLDRGRGRPVQTGALHVHIPPDDRWTSTPSGVVRVGRVSRRGLRDDHTLLVPSLALERELVAQGVAPERIDVMPPPVRPVEVGAGGAGVLALLPSHDQQGCTRILAALANVAVPVTLLPNVRNYIVEALSAEFLPSATLLDPTTDELVYGQLAGQFDVVVGAGEDDPFERRSLIAAAAGAAAVTRMSGPAAEVLDERLAVDARLDPDELSVAVARALSGDGDRAARAARVRAACGPEALAPRISALLAAQRPERVRLAVDELDIGAEHGSPAPVVEVSPDAAVTR